MSFLSRIPRPLRQLLFCFLTALALYIPAYLALERHLQARGDAELQWFRDRGHPTRPAELIYQATAEDDALPFWLAAADQYEALGGSRQIEHPSGNEDEYIEPDFLDGRLVNTVEEPPVPLTAEQVRQLTDIMHRNGPVLQTLHKAAERPDCSSPTDYSGGITTLLPSLGVTTRLARLLHLDAELAFARGDADAAIRAWADLASLRRYPDSERCLIGCLLRISIDTLLDQSLQSALVVGRFTPDQLVRLADITPEDVDAARDVPEGIALEVVGLNAQFSLWLDLAPSLSAFARAVRRASANRRLTLWGIALLRYKAAHGRYPAALADIPVDLRRDPLPVDDPLATTGDSDTSPPLVYRLQDDGSCILYSVGDDHTDNGGTPGPLPDSRADGTDIVLHLPR